MIRKWQNPCIGADPLILSDVLSLLFAAMMVVMNDRFVLLLRKSKF
jgi:hypothetical protein